MKSYSSEDNDPHWYGKEQGDAEESDPMGNTFYLTESGRDDVERNYPEDTWR